MSTYFKFFPGFIVVDVVVVDVVVVDVVVVDVAMEKNLC